MSTTKIIEDFIQAAADHGHFTEIGVPSKCNAAHDRLRKVGAKLLSCPDKGEAVFRLLVTYENGSVRGWAAYYLLLFDETKALAVLESVSQHSGLVAFGAEMTIKEWKSGRLKVF